MGWQWSASAREYTDAVTGESISREELTGLQSDFVAKMGDQFRDAATALHGRGASPDEWETELRRLVDRTQAISYQLSRGGSRAMQDSDWSQVASRIASDYEYLNAFAQDAG